MPNSTNGLLREAVDSIVAHGVLFKYDDVDYLRLSVRLRMTAKGFMLLLEVPIS